ncbi:MAG: cytochrome oxidase assembly protein [Rhodothermales bacterium]|nr:cytochrome oxidase assembly protein [Rhodothermales bacterium]
MRARHLFTLLTVFATILLMGWGAFVTSIDAGLAVPDWPSSFNSYDPLNPWPGWWTITPVLAEHGHRLLGALVGLLVLILSIWTFAADSRRWMRRLAVGVLALVMLQGFLGGLRVVWVSLDLAVVHACVAQLFFSMMVCMALFTSRSWTDVEDSHVGQSAVSNRLVKLGAAASVAIYIQIILGALLRHPGTGIDLSLAGLHIFWAFVVVGLVLATAYEVHRSHRHIPTIRRSRDAMLGLLVVQFMLGLTAFFVLLDEVGMVQPSNLQVASNTSHMVIGALLMASSVALLTWSLRERHRFAPGASPISPKSVPQPA